MLWLVKISVSIQLAVLTGWLAATSLLGCAAPAGDAPDAGAPDAAPPEPQGGSPGGPLAINEVAPDPAGGAADWIELINRGDAAIDLCGYFLTDQADRLDHYHPLGGVLPPEPCPPRLLAPGARLVVVADDGASGDVDAAGFALAHADEVHVVAIDGLVVDGVLFLLPDGARGRSLARVPDGEGRFHLVEPTAGAANPEAP